MKTERTVLWFIAFIGVVLILVARWPEMQQATLVTGYAQSYPADIQAINPVSPDCVLRDASDPADRMLELTGEGFSTTDHNLQLQRVDTGALSIHFHSEVNWESTTRITVDVASIKHLLWLDSKVTLKARLTTFTGGDFVPVSDWSPAFILADDETACSVPPPVPIPPDDPIVDVYVMNFDPLIDGTPLIQYQDDSIGKGVWNEPAQLMPAYITDVLESSGGVVHHNIVRESIIRTYPTKPGGFVFTNAEYLLCLEKEFKREAIPQYCRNLIDYAVVLNTRYDPDYVSACEAVATEDVDEIWLWGGPWFGYLEWKTIDPFSLCEEVPERFTVMGFSYQRQVTEMLHDLGHRAEGVLLGQLGETLWNQFDGQRQRYPQDYECPASPDPGHPEVDANNTHCGNVHFPPNAYCHYQYDRNFPVQSDCDDWLNYPYLTGAQTPVNADTWTGNQRGFLKWWLSHFPHQPGIYNDLYNNWWGYIFPIPKISFVDVPFEHWAYYYIELFYQAGYTEGCSTNPLQYCPEESLTRAEMAVFLVRAVHGPDYIPPLVHESSFQDVSSDHWAIEWIEQLYQDGYIAGCNADPLRYCPDDAVSRAEMAVFLVRVKHGPDYIPPPMEASSFEDVPPDHWAIEWIEQLWEEEITAGCWANPLRYCPDRSVTQAEMAVFLTRALELLSSSASVRFVTEGPVYSTYLPLILK